MIFAQQKPIKITRLTVKKNRSVSVTLLFLLEKTKDTSRIRGMYVMLFLDLLPKFLTNSGAELTDIDIDNLWHIKPFINFSYDLFLAGFLLWQYQHC